MGLEIVTNGLFLFIKINREAEISVLMISLLKVGLFLLMISFNILNILSND
jgi:hypothetical protein